MPSRTTASALRPLAGIRVLELAGLHPGPHACMLLSQLGADVIKVERPDSGDGTRAMGRQIFESLNRNKRSIALDMKTPEGKQAVDRLFGHCDVVVEGFRPGVARRLGVDYTQARSINSRIVYCSISSFGQSGPYLTRSAHDLNYLSLGGYFAPPSQVDDVTARPKVRLADFAGSMYAALSIATAALAARQSGDGCYLDVSIHDAITAWCLPYALALRSGLPGGIDHSPSVMPDNDLFVCADDRWLSLGIFENKYWAELRDLLADEFPEVANPEFLPRAARMARKREVSALLKRIFLSKPSAAWAQLFENSSLPWSLVYERDEVLDDPHVVARQMVTQHSADDGSVWSDIRFPVLFEGVVLNSSLPAPDLGQHTEEILSEIGLSAD